VFRALDDQFWVLEPNHGACLGQSQGLYQHQRRWRTEHARFGVGGVPENAQLAFEGEEHRDEVRA